MGVSLMNLCEAPRDESHSMVQDKERSLSEGQIFMCLEGGNLEVRHSVILSGTDTVKVEFKRCLRSGYQLGYCVIPGYTWTNVDGFTVDDMHRFIEFTVKYSDVLIALARNNGYATDYN